MRHRKEEFFLFNLTASVFNGSSFTNKQRETKDNDDMKMNMMMMMKKKKKKKEEEHQTTAKRTTTLEWCPPPPPRKNDQPISNLPKILFTVALNSSDLMVS